MPLREPLRSSSSLWWTHCHYCCCHHHCCPRQCREGTAWTTKILERILKGQGKHSDLDLLLDLSEQMTGRTICVLSDSCAAPIVSGITKFPEEFEAYLSRAKAPALAAV